jgi:Ca-activated chloride channel family protein
LEHTSVRAEVSGFVARVEVKQVFANPHQEKIEAIYTFPLSAEAAVYEMLMKVGDRVVRGEIRTREEASRIYTAAREKGHVASLLDQERPNIFTQSVANIMPGEKVEITIKYVEVLGYEDGAFKFVFPMVVGPRFIPGLPAGRQGTGWADDTSMAPDASRITPPVAEEGQRAGHDIDIAVSIDAGVPIETIESLLHEVDTSQKEKNKALVMLKNKKEIPNKDFVLKYLVAANQMRSGLLAHREGESGYVTVIMVPPKRVTPEQIAPRELIFVIDTSGSQMGMPLEKAKETTKYIIDRMNPNDTFNVIDFNDTARVLFPSPKKNTPESREKALKYIGSLQGSGGTRMIPAIWEALSAPPADNRLRVVTFMTDGLVGNDFEVISIIKKLRDQSRWFSFGAGNSVNRFLLDHVARVGGGEVDYILLNSPGEEVAKKFHERIAGPVLTNISLSFTGVALEEVYPTVVSDLWSHKPLIFKARYSKAGEGTVTIKGLKGGKPYEETLKVKLPEKQPANNSLKPLWARAKVQDLMDRDPMGIQRGNPQQGVKEEIIKVALSHNIMTQFTSLVAVEEATVTVGGKPTKVTVPVEMPEGVSREGVFGTRSFSTTTRPAGVPAQGQITGNFKVKQGVARVTGVFQRAPEARKMALEEAAPASPRSSVPAMVEGRQGLRQERRLEADFSSAKLAAELAELAKMKDKPKAYSKGRVHVTDGKVAVKVWLDLANEETIKLLEAKGLKVIFLAASGKMVIGEISIERLEDLAKAQEVRFVEPFAAMS